ncbi:hypothetical protein KFE25_003815 [Diacronema lutheri]|uniref:MORN repeat-containing protein 3 n=1 Tax=Diacronema lutheri TaxID=2081491 RepID=A0A8J5XGL1_DIALT|nr:hypothetical protein KFE25_003815 [Diacronema lutheri]
MELDASQLPAAGLKPKKLSLSQTRDLISQKSGDRRTIYWSKGKPGAYTTAAKYLGQWQDNKKHGKGTQTWANGDKYVGEWLEGKPSGFGTFWKQGSKALLKQYAGQWAGGKQNGRGVHYYDDGGVYDGQWRNGLRHGVGTMSYADGSVYEGDWFNDKRHGFGIFDHANGDHFEGHYVEDKREGEGVHFYFSAEKKTHHKRMDGEWVDDVCKCSIYSEMEPDPNVPASEKPEPLPKLHLLKPDSVLAVELLRIREQRAHHRATRVTIDEHFTEEELAALRTAFGRVDVDEQGALTLAQLREAFLHIGMDPTNYELETVLGNFRSEPASDDTRFTFADFAQACDLLSPIDS